MKNLSIIGFVFTFVLSINVFRLVYFDDLKPLRNLGYMNNFGLYGMIRVGDYLEYGKF